MLSNFESSNPVLHGSNGALVFDGKGALYGTINVPSGDGGVAGFSVFKLAPPAAGKAGNWVLTDLDLHYGQFTELSVIFGRDCALYGTTNASGGTVFRLPVP